MPVDRRFVVKLKGKEYPTYPGALDLATQAGIKALTTRLIQIPTPENGKLAIVEATLVMADDRVFTDYGEACPASTGIGGAYIRIASTRAKGRVLRDCGNIGEALLDDADADETPEVAPVSARTPPRPAAPPPPRPAPAAAQAPATVARPPAPPSDERTREDAEARVCALLDEAGKRGGWEAPGDPLARFLDYAYDEKTLGELAEDARDLERMLHAPAGPGAAPPPEGALACRVCGKALTKGQAEISKRAFNGALLCPEHQREAARQAA